jgi:hypothetical protein
MKTKLYRTIDIQEDKKYVISQCAKTIVIEEIVSDEEEITDKCCIRFTKSLNGGKYICINYDSSSIGRVGLTGIQMNSGYRIEKGHECATFSFKIFKINK